jgi:hypothetical protein
MPHQQFGNDRNVILLVGTKRSSSNEKKHRFKPDTFESKMLKTQLFYFGHWRFKIGVYQHKTPDRLEYITLGAGMTPISSKVPNWTQVISSGLD